MNIREKTVSMEKDAPKKGVILRLFGVILIFLGIMDSMLSWRGGFAVSDFYVLLILSGGSLYIIGSIIRSSRS